MTRYFMTIPEAAQLVVQAGGVGQSGDVFVLDMGDPVRIVDLAHDMIRLSGKRARASTTAIEIVGMRPGEKLHEKLFNPDERSRPTPADKIMVAVRGPVGPEWVDEAFALVEELVEGRDPSGLAALVEGLRAERAAGPPEPAAPAPERDAGAAL